MEKAKDFCLKDAFENEVCLKDLVKDNEYVVLYFYPKDNTPGCTTEAIEFTRLLEKFKSLKTVVVGVSADICESHKKFIAKHNLEVILLSDPDKEAIKLYGVWGKKKLYGKEIEGTVRSTFIIDKNFNIIKSWKNVKAKGHAEQVLNFLKSVAHE